MCARLRHTASSCSANATSEIATLSSQCKILSSGVKGALRCRQSARYAPRFLVSMVCTNPAIGKFG